MCTKILNIIPLHEEVYSFNVHRNLTIDHVKRKYAQVVSYTRRVLVTSIGSSWRTMNSIVLWKEIFILTRGSVYKQVDLFRKMRNLKTQSKVNTALDLFEKCISEFDSMKGVLDDKCYWLLAIFSKQSKYLYTILSLCWRLEKHSLLPVEEGTLTCESVLNIIKQAADVWDSNTWKAPKDEENDSKDPKHDNPKGETDLAKLLKMEFASLGKDQTRLTIRLFLHLLQHTRSYSYRFCWNIKLSWHPHQLHYRNSTFYGR